jgi:hypothetical protein
MSGADKKESSRINWWLHNVTVGNYRFMNCCKMPTICQRQSSVTLEIQSMSPVENTYDAGWHPIGQGQSTRFEKMRSDKSKKGDDTEQHGDQYISKRGNVAKECESEDDQFREICVNRFTFSPKRILQRTSNLVGGQRQSTWECSNRGGEKIRNSGPSQKSGLLV